MTFTLETEARLLGWSDTSHAGRTSRFEFPLLTDRAHPFWGLPYGAKTGQRFKMTLVAIDDNEEPREPPVLGQEGSRPPESVTSATRAASEPGGASLCPGDNQPCYVDIDPDEAHWRCGTVQCGRKDSSGRSVHISAHMRTEVDRRRYAAFLRAVRDYPTNPDFVAWVSRKVGRIGTADEIASYIKWRCGIDTRLDIKTDETAHKKFEEMEAEFDAETPGRIAERRG